MMLLAERKKNAAMAKTAFSQIKTQSGGHGPYADYYKAQLPKARALLDRLSSR
jgi:hypothetical protein